MTAAGVCECPGPVKSGQTAFPDCVGNATDAKAQVFSAYYNAQKAAYLQAGSAGAPHIPAHYPCPRTANNEALEKVCNIWYPGVRSKLGQI